ncbi:DUF1648 domain-containing protein [Lacticaseibacillus kribbianus]|uniref:DUF1648 domain-containing protein n=1 Tax=Lacticaseibacillus kribbianus TaxID=2926292 RepID=UPI001CD5CFBB|nr:DUF1648 domain-containing protein [Lacticaseibacillus kribbianus]
MRNPKRILATTLPVILAPILYGLAVYSKLPATMAIHWGVDSQPNGWAPRAFVVFGLPALMAVFQLITVLVPRGNQSAPRFERVVNWVMPVLTVVLYVTTIQIGLGRQLDVWRIATFLIGVMFLAMGNYIPTVSPEYSTRALAPRRKMGRAALRRLGRVMVVAGLLLLVSLFLRPAVSIVVLTVTGVAMLAMPLTAK